MEGSFYSFLEDNIVLIAVFSVLVCIVYGYRTLFSSGAYGDLLSARHVRSPPRTLITDPRARNAVLKQSKSTFCCTLCDHLSFTAKIRAVT